MGTSSIFLRSCLPMRVIQFRVDQLAQRIVIPGKVHVEMDVIGYTSAAWLYRGFFSDPPTSSIGSPVSSISSIGLIIWMSILWKQWDAKLASVGLNLGRIANALPWILDSGFKA